MLISRCRQLRPLVTSYVDKEVSQADRLIVEDHLRECQACRERVARQEAVHHLLRGRSREAHLHGTPVSWSPRPDAPGRATGRRFVRLSVAAAAGLAVGLVVWNPWRTVPLAARGHISDSTCGGRHLHAAPQLQNVPGRDCVRLCIELGAQFIFVSDGTIFSIRNQAFEDLARFAEQDVEIEGEVRGKQLTVSHVRPVRAVARVAPTHSAPDAVAASAAYRGVNR